MSVGLALCATGLALGIVHVLTGPDHLSAIATLSVNVGDFRAFWYGIRWGIGHSIGLVVVGSVFIALENIHFDKDTIEDGSVDNSSRVIEIPENIENLAACFVGIFMLALGFYNMYWAHRRRKAQSGRCHHEHCHHKHKEHDDEEQKGQLSCDSLTETTESISDYGDRLSTQNDDLSKVKDPMGINKKVGTNNSKDKDKDIASKKWLSLCVGIFHGVAGPGGVLGVVPAIKLHNVWYSIAYLGSFCASSIATMGCFAALYGSLSARWTSENDVLAFRMEVFSASLSILVGCTWLVLLYLGILDEVFG